MKTRRLLVCLLTGALGGCGGSTQSPDRPNPTATKPDATQRTVDRLDSWIAAWNSHDVEAFMSHLVPGTVGNYIGQATPSSPKPIADEREQFKTIWGLFPDTREDAMLLMANDNRGAVLYRIDTGKGQTFAVAAMTGHAPDGRVSEYHSVTDGLTQLHQWGVLPSADAPDAEPRWDPPVRAVDTDPEIEKANVEILRQFSAAWSINDTDAIASLVAPDYSHRALPLKAAVDGTTLLATLSERAGTVATVVDVQETWGAGNWVVQRAELTMKFTGGENAGKSAKFGGIFFAEILDGKIARTIGAFNNAQVLVNLGEMTPAQFDALEAELLKKIGLDDAR